MKIEIEITDEQLRVMRKFYAHERTLSDKEFAEQVIRNIIALAMRCPEKYFDECMF